ncbi:uncharacterized protein [Elaeis guineensis]|uniref:RING-type E3 ubiquitin transferase n=1 Tax=Elaeis guineensis var. tenera TaxID=51953 RepID=A0A6I9RIZ9_ELAGV|nr:uncharacterized protein LOC105049200 [Elaeis guineensis]XP_010927069.1 uncharacterized protein LOC105049200 [Elaeis guineensis]XP_010927070.1 uncharacterized protein LOC105049200 [Elaeis guineensis]XP_019707555.1 uncharacterized protein LOC105049200 [Elaeis guineensis]
MDELMGKKAAEGHDFSSRGSSIVFRDQNHDARSIQYCNRLGCSTRLNSIKGTQIGSSEKAKYVKASFHSTSSKTITGNSSKSLSSNSGYRKSFQDRQKQTLQREKAIAETSNRQGKIEDSECNSTQGFLEDLGVRSQETEDSKFSESNPTSVAIQTALPDSKDLELLNLEGSSLNTMESSGSCTIASSSKPYKHIKKLGSGNQVVSSRSSFRHSTYAFRNCGNAARPGSQVLGTGAQKSGIKTLSCTSVSDVLPSGCSSSDFSCDRQTDTVRKRPSVGESSAAKGKGESGPSTGRYLGSAHTGISDSGRSLPQQLMPQQTFIRAGNRPTSRDGAVSVRTRRASTGDARTRLSEQGVGNILPVHEPIMIPHLQQNRVSIPETVPESSSHSFSMELPNVLLNSSEHPGSRSRAARSRMVSRPEGGSTHNFHSSSGDRDGYRQFNMDRIAEVLLALERMEQDEELTYEQLLVLETNLVLGDLSFHDQHRDMRMDIDNMSYEELLALEEKMGTVSTALSDEQLSKCLKRSLYRPASEVLGIMDSGDDTECSICQEEYASGDEVGELACEHRYHVACIHQWLRQKNWCPICKASAIPS